MKKSKPSTMQVVDLSALEETYISIDKQMELLKGLKAFIKDQILAEFDARGISRSNELQLVLQERTTVDSLALKAVLPVATWNKIRADKVDMDKLEAALKVGEVDINVAEQCIARTSVKVLRII